MVSRFSSVLSRCVFCSFLSVYGFGFVSICQCKHVGVRMFAQVFVCRCVPKYCAFLYVYVCILDWRVHVGMWPFLFEDMIVGRLASVTVYVTK